MKSTYLLPVVLATGLLAGCQSTSKSASSSHASPAGQSVSSFDTSQLVSAFRNADLNSTQLVQEVVASVGKKDWSGALGQLQKLQRIPGLTAAQADSVHSLISGISTKAK